MKQKISVHCSAVYLLSVSAFFAVLIWFNGRSWLLKPKTRMNEYSNFRVLLLLYHANVLIFLLFFNLVKFAKLLNSHPILTKLVTTKKKKNVNTIIYYSLLKRTYNLTDGDLVHYTDIGRARTAGRVFRIPARSACAPCLPPCFGCACARGARDTEALSKIGLSRWRQNNWIFFLRFSNPYATRTIVTIHKKQNVDAVFVFQ